MDCIHEVEDEQARYGTRRVSAAFHLAVIERALGFISEHAGCAAAPPTTEVSSELVAVCDEALDALADLKTALSRLT